MRTYLMMATLLISACAIAGEFRELTVSLQTPHPGYGLHVERADLKAGVLHVLARVVQPDPDMMYPMVIGTATDTVQVKAPAAEIKLFLLDRGWDWGEEDAQAVADEAAYAEITQGATPVEIRR